MFQVSEVLKLGCIDYEALKQFTVCIEEKLFKMDVHRYYHQITRGKLSTTCLISNHVVNFQPRVCPFFQRSLVDVQNRRSPTDCGGGSLRRTSGSSIEISVLRKLSGHFDTILTSLMICLWCLIPGQNGSRGQTDLPRTRLFPFVPLGYARGGIGGKRSREDGTGGCG